MSSIRFKSESAFSSTMAKYFYCSALILAVLPCFGAGSPLYDVYRVEREPDAIPMQNLNLPFDVGFPEKQSLDRGDEVWNNVHKRTRHGGSRSENGFPSSCCPTVIDVIQPTHGMNRSGDLVELYQSETVRQRFYENSCAPLVADEPCRYLDRKHASKSRCVQQYSYTYAMVRDFGAGSSEWKLDYIQVRSGCSCQIH